MYHTIILLMFPQRYATALHPTDAELLVAPQSPPRTTQRRSGHAVKGGWTNRDAPGHAQEARSAETEPKSKMVPTATTTSERACSSKWRMLLLSLRSTNETSATWHVSPAVSSFLTVVSKGCYRDRRRASAKLGSP